MHATACVIDIRVLSADSEDTAMLTGRVVVVAVERQEIVQSRHEAVDEGQLRNKSCNSHCRDRSRKDQARTSPRKADSKKQADCRASID